MFGVRKGQLFGPPGLLKERASWKRGKKLLEKSSYGGKWLVMERISLEQEKGFPFHSNRQTVTAQTESGNFLRQTQGWYLMLCWLVLFWKCYKKLKETTEIYPMGGGRIVRPTMRRYWRLWILSSFICQTKALGPEGDEGLLKDFKLFIISDFALSRQLFRV